MHIEVLVRLYRTLVGEDGARDLPHPPPEKGYFFCPMPPVNRLWASIEFASSSDGLTATLLVYSPGEGSEGGDAVYLTIHGRKESFTSPRHIICDHLDQDNRSLDQRKIAECRVIQILLNRMVSESYPKLV